MRAQQRRTALLAFVARHRWRRAGATRPVAELAPTGRLRAAISLGTPILAGRDAGGRPVGVSVDLANELGQGSGLVAAALKRHNIDGALVAPAGR